MGFRLQALGFRVWGFGFRVSRLLLALVLVVVVAQGTQR